MPRSVRHWIIIGGAIVVSFVAVFLVIRVWFNARDGFFLAPTTPSLTLPRSVGPSSSEEGRQKTGDTEAGTGGVVWRVIPSVPYESPEREVGKVILEDASATLPELPRVTSTPPIASNKTGKPPQFVTLAFDGSRSLETWRKTREFARMMSARGTPVHFTYFISGVYLLAQADRALYRPPEHASGTSAIGFADSHRDVANRLEQMNGAMQEGHEIASHANGHFDGSKWTKDEWEQEFSSFQSLVSNVTANNKLEKETPARRELQLQKSISGFRAPELGRDDGLWQTLQAYGFRYDTSGVGKPNDWPKKQPQGFWSFPLARIRYATTTRSLLAMDYNFYFSQSGAKDTAKRGTPEWERMYSDMLTSYEQYFWSNYLGNRAPINIGHHFSAWNDGVYWEVMQAFALEVCGLPDVRCANFSELADYMDQRGK